MVLRVLLSFLVLCGLGAVAFGGEALSVGTVLADPRAYHMQEVTLHGKVRDVRGMAPFRKGVLLCWGFYTFTLEDGTGAIEVFVQGPCTMNIMDPTVKPAQVTEGDNITVEASIFVGDYASGEYNPNGKVTAMSKSFDRNP